MNSMMNKGITVRRTLCMVERPVQLRSAEKLLLNYKMREIESTEYNINSTEPRRGLGVKNKKGVYLQILGHEVKKKK